jgi:hypothetical protein
MVKENNVKSPVCYCGVDFTEYQKQQMHELVCRDWSAKYTKDGQNYCIFHFPSDEKKEDFSVEYYKRLNKKIICSTERSSLSKLTSEGIHLINT